MSGAQLPPYDKNGNLIERAIDGQADASVVYDYQNRMVSFEAHGLNATHTHLICYRQ